MKFTKSKNFEKHDYVNEAMETLNLMVRRYVFKYAKNITNAHNTLINFFNIRNFLEWGEIENVLR